MDLYTPNSTQNNPLRRDKNSNRKLKINFSFLMPSFMFTNFEKRNITTGTLWKNTKTSNVVVNIN